MNINLKAMYVLELSADEFRTVAKALRAYTVGDAEAVDKAKVLQEQLLVRRAELAEHFYEEADKGRQNIAREPLVTNRQAYEILESKQAQKT
jgi:hypothetical protein